MPTNYEAEVIAGIEHIAIQELQEITGLQPEKFQQIRPGFIRFTFDGNSTILNKFQSIISIYAIHYFDIPRPKALLGHEHFARLVSILTGRLSVWAFSEPVTFGIGVAGSDSSVINRLKQEISSALNINESSDGKGELFWRLIRAHDRQGWDVLIRLTPKPLATRAWRSINIPGALNATVAYAMTRLIAHQTHMKIVNLCSGTGTILIEHKSSNSNHQCIAIDNDRSMLDYAKLHYEQSSTTNDIQQICCEAQQTPLAPSFVDCIYADLPFGHHIGSHDTNEWLYPAILDEVARIAKPTASFVLITHEIQLLEESVRYSAWYIKSQLKINLNGLHPRIFVLEQR